MKIPHSVSRKLWIPLLATVLGIPLISWAAHAPLKDSLSSSYLFMTLLGQVLGIVGAQLFAVALLLGARLKVMEYCFGGLDTLYRIHHRIGVIAFTFLAVHPLILAFRFVTDGMEEVMMFLIPVNNTLARDFGIYALLSMFVLLCITFYGVIFSYANLKTAHRFMGAAFFLGTLHILLIPSSISSDSVLKVSCLGMALVGCIAYAYRTLFGTYLVPRSEYVVNRVTRIGENITEVVLSPLRRSFVNLPGQFAFLSFIDTRVIPQEEHPFTISSAYTNGDIRFSVKALGDYTANLSSLNVGTKAYVEGPFGDFSYTYGSSSQVWVAGGIGVTPFLSMAEDLLQKETMEYTIDFFYSVRSERDGVYKEVFMELAHKHKSFTFHFMPSDTSGFVTGEGIANAVNDLTTRDIFVCGPPPMMKALTAGLIGCGVSKDRVRSERFSLLK